ncbi:MAG: ABC transporter permease [Bacteroidales bacterium]|nr:ABC transporter permease [Bacteroidales bacterium]
MNVRLFIARRYLFARKSHNVINVISAISAIGMAIGTAALVLILSVYNGFDDLIQRNIGDFAPDLLMASPDGSSKFSPDSLLIDAIAADSRVESVRYTLEDNVFLTYGDRQAIARAKGVEDGFEQSPRLIPHITEGESAIRKGDAPAAIVGAGLARNLGLHPRFLDRLVLYYPDKNGRISPSNPAASAVSRSVAPSGIISVSSEADASLVIVPLYVMQSLTGTPDGVVSAVEINLKDNSRRAVRRFKKDYAGSCTLLEREEQQRDLFRMMKYEKAAIFLILIFVVLIVALNIYGSLSMLIIEKEDDIATLRAMGASRRLTRQIFVLEGWLISLLGLAAGLVIGSALALAQQKLGFVKMPGNYLVDAYPVVVQPSDIILTAAAVALIGLLVALVSAGRRSSGD